MSETILQATIYSNFLFVCHGRRYYLDENPGSAPLFNFGSKPKLAEPVPPKATSNVVASSKQAVEARKAAEEAKKAKLEAAKRARNEAMEKMKADLEAKKLEAKQKREAKLAATKKKREVAASEKKVNSNVDSKAAALLVGKKRGSTISLRPKSEVKPASIFGLGSSTKTTVSVPKGIPVISNFKQNRDGSLTGFISGSNSFKDGEKVTTSKLAPGQTVTPGKVVTTISNSKYFLK
jgi:hypothetical protein